MIKLLCTSILAGLALCANFDSLVAQDNQSQEQERQKRRIKSEELLKDAPRIEIEFVDNKRVPSSLLIEQMKLSGGLNSTGSLALRAPLFFDHLLDDLQRIRFFYGTQGYLEARISEPEVKDLGDRVKITVGIREGAHYWVGEIKVKGAKAFTPEQVIETSGLKPGSVIDVRIIQENIFAGIKNKYADEGYIQASVDFIPQFKVPYPDSPEGIVDVTLDVDEGRVFFIRSIGLSGLKKTEEQTLRKLLPVREGVRYSERDLKEALRILNQLGRFEEIQKKDVIIRTNDADRTVDLDFELAEKDKR